VVNKTTATTENHFRKEKSENAKGVMRDRKSKDKQIPPNWARICQQNIAPNMGPKEI
jgi:hypothetical protein